MPTFARVLLMIAIASVCRAAGSQDDHRYADWRGAEQPQSEEQNLRPAADEQTDGNESAGNAARVEPPDGLRKLPFRFARAPADSVRSHVIRASATEAAPSPLTRPGESRPLGLKGHNGESASKRKTSGLQPGVTIGGSLAIVVGLFLIVAWMARRGMPKQPPLLPREAIEVLGRQRFGGKQQEVQLLRIGNKLVLVHVMAGHVEPLSEITDPAEVDRLTGICYQADPSSSTRRFQQTFEQLAKDNSSSTRASRDDPDKFDPSIFDDAGRKVTRAL